jgi:hypothetical protein
MAQGWQTQARDPTPRLFQAPGASGIHTLALIQPYPKRITYIARSTVGTSYLTPAAQSRSARTPTCMPSVPTNQRGGRRCEQGCRRWYGPVMHAPGVGVGGGVAPLLTGHIHAGSLAGQHAGRQHP